MIKVETAVALTDTTSEVQHHGIEAYRPVAPTVSGRTSPPQELSHVFSAWSANPEVAVDLDSYRPGLWGQGL